MCVHILYFSAVATVETAQENPSTACHVQEGFARSVFKFQMKILFVHHGILTEDWEKGT